MDSGGQNVKHIYYMFYSALSVVVWLDDRCDRDDLMGSSPVSIHQNVQPVTK